jgi:acyl-CoA synthetase (NDP forming)
MAGPGVELLVGLSHDPLFGPVIACGAGGVEAELLKDVSVRLTPLGPSEAREMLASLVTYPRLTGWRGSEPADIAAIVDILLRVGRLADEHAEIIEMDLNPVFVTPQGAAIVDARVRVAEAAPPAPWPAA